MRLVDKITNGSRVEINETGTRITFVPGKVWNDPGNLANVATKTSTGLQHGPFSGKTKGKTELTSKLK